MKPGRVCDDDLKIPIRIIEVRHITPLQERGKGFEGWKVPVSNRSVKYHGVSGFEVLKWDILG